MKYIFFLLAASILSCHSHSSGGYSDGSSDEHSHDISEAHSHIVDSKPTEVYTIWTDQTELFVEFPALVVGETSRFAAHFTILDGHKPVKEGSVTASLISATKGIRHTVDAPSSPGIFTPSLQPKEAGIFQLIFELSTPAYTDRIIIDSLRVFASEEESTIVLGAEEEDENGISFLKEQAWKTEFQTAPALKKQIYQTVSTSGVWKVAPSDYQTLVAPSSGRVRFTSNALTEGSTVRRGQVLMDIISTGLTSNNLSAEIQKAEADYEQARSELGRKEKLHESGIVPKAELEKAKQKFLLAKTNYETLSSGYISGGKQVIAQIDGYINSMKAVNGGFVNQGDPLITLTSQKRSLLQVQVSPTYYASIQHIQNIWYQPDQDTWSDMNSKGGKILSIDKEVDADQPLISVFAEINEGIEMPKGSFTEVQLAIGKPNESVVIPVSCLLEDYGTYSVFVQVSGERFERRNVMTGRQNGGEVEIIKGLHPGEIVVVTGAYQVRMAAMAGQAPAHGHSH